LLTSPFTFGWTHPVFERLLGSFIDDQSVTPITSLPAGWTNMPTSWPSLSLSANDQSLSSDRSAATY